MAVSVRAQTAALAAARAGVGILAKGIETGSCLLVCRLLRVGSVVVLGLNCFF